MHRTTEQLVGALVERAGSISAAAEMSGIASRVLQRWVSGSASPSPSSLQRIRAALEGDDLQMRKRRIEVYRERASQERDLFT